MRIRPNESETWMNLDIHLFERQQQVHFAHTYNLQRQIKTDTNNFNDAYDVWRTLAASSS